MKLKINPLVVVDLKHIRDYIAEDNRDAAQKMVTEIYDTFQSIQRFPNIGGNLSKRVHFKTDYKYLVHKNYITIYKICSDSIEIYRVIDRFQDITSVLFY